MGRRAQRILGRDGHLFASAIREQAGAKLRRRIEPES
jgi:hypothetical protein